MTCLCREEFCFKCGCGSCPSAFNLTHYLLPLLVALWDTVRRKCTSNPPCKLRGEMALQFSGGEREANANHMVQVAARPGPPLPVRPQAVNFIGGDFQPPAHEPPHRRPPHSTSQYSNCNHGGDFSWIDNPSTYTQFTMGFTITIQSESTRYRESHPPVHTRDGDYPQLRIL